MAKRRKEEHKTLRKYRLIILDEKTFEEKVSFRVSRLKVILFFWSFSILLICLTVSAIIFTPLQYYLPGVSTPKVRRQFVNYMEQVDSIADKMALNETYLNSLRSVLVDNISSDEANENENKNPVIEKTSFQDVELLDEDLGLRKEIDSLERESLSSKSIYKNLLKTVFSPIDGVAFLRDETGLKIDKNLYGVDLYAPSRTPIKAVMGGTVIYVGKSRDHSSEVIILSHTNGLHSIYRFASTSLKKKGDVVAAGEVISTTSETVDESGDTFPSLHFELWFDGIPLDPLDIINVD